MPAIAGLINPERGKSGFVWSVPNAVGGGKLKRPFAPTIKIAKAAVQFSILIFQPGWQVRSGSSHQLALPRPQLHDKLLALRNIETKVAFSD